MASIFATLPPFGKWPQDNGLENLNNDCYINIYDELLDNSFRAPITIKVSDLVRFLVKCCLYGLSKIIKLMAILG